jgi:hypothetical protein
VACAGTFRPTEGRSRELVTQLRDKGTVRFAVFRRRGHRMHANFG